MKNPTFYFLRKYKAVYGSIFTLSLLYSILESINISVFLPIFQLILGKQGDLMPVASMGWIMRLIKIIPGKDILVSACLFSVLILVVKEGIGFLRQTLISYGMGKVTTDTRKAVFEKYLNSDYQLFLDKKQGELVYNTLTAPLKLSNCLYYMPEIVSAVFMILCISAVLFSISFKMTAILLAGGFFINFFTQFLAKKVSYHLGSGRVIFNTKINILCNEFIDGIKHIKLFNSFNFWRNKFDSDTEKLQELVIKDGIWLAVPERLIQLAPAVLIVILLISIKFFSLSPSTLLVHFAKISVYVYAFYRLMPYLTSLGKLKMQLMGTLPDVELLYRILNKENTRQIEYGNREFKGIQKGIFFKDVSFDYKNKKNVLKNLNFSIEKGKLTAIVGPSGSGKTTIINLIMRLFKPTKGEILFDSVVSGDFSNASVSLKIGLVSQDTFVFHGSVKENILFGYDNRSDDDLYRAAKLAHAHDFIMEFPQKYETIVGDKGLKVSGGQRQRIAIARTVIRNPEILILDEATSSLDHISESIVQNAITEVSVDKTVIVIAHRLSTIRNADKIIVIDNGEILEEGRHEELMARKGGYFKLYESQVLAGSSR